MKGLSRVLLLLLALLLVYGISQVLPSGIAAADQPGQGPSGLIASVDPQSWRIERQDYFEQWMTFSYSRLNSTAWNFSVQLQPAFIANLTQCLTSCNLTAFKQQFNLNVSNTQLLQDLLNVTSYPISNLSNGIALHSLSVDLTQGSVSFVAEFPNGFVLGQAFKFGLHSAVINSTTSVDQLLKNMNLVRDMNGNYWASVMNDTSSNLYNSTSPASSWSYVNTTFSGANQWHSVVPAAKDVLGMISRSANQAAFYNYTSNNTAGRTSFGETVGQPNIFFNSTNGFIVVYVGGSSDGWSHNATSNYGTTWLTASTSNPPTIGGASSNRNLAGCMDSNNVIHFFTGKQVSLSITEIHYFNYTAATDTFSSSDVTAETIINGSAGPSYMHSFECVVDTANNEHILYGEANLTASTGGAQTNQIRYFNRSSNGAFSVNINLTNQTTNWTGRMFRVGNTIGAILVDEDFVNDINSQNITYYMTKGTDNEWGALTLYRRNARGISPRGTVFPAFNKYDAAGNATLEFLWMNTTTSSSLQIQYDSLNLNSAPVINSVQLNASSLGGSQNLTLQVNVTDADGNSQRDNASFGTASTRTYSGDFAILDIPDTLSQAGNVTANDTSGAAAANFAINFTLTNRTYQENSSWSHNLTLQHIQKNDTLVDNASSTSLSYNVTHSIPSGATVVGGGNFSGSLTAGNAVNFTTEFSGDFLTETLGGEAQETANTTEAGVNAFSRRELNITNSQTFSFSNVNLSGICRSGWTQNITSLTITSSGVTSYIVGCNLTTAVTKARNQYNITPGAQVIVGQNTTGFMEILANNTDTAVSYTGVLVNASTVSLLPSNWILNDTQTYLVNLTNGTWQLHNVTIQTNSSLVQFLSPAASDCTGWTIYSNYCYLDTSTDLGSGHTRHNSTVRVKINSTDNFAADFNVAVPIPLSDFTNWNIRNANSESPLVNSSSKNLTVTSDSSNVNVTIGTNYSTSSIRPGFYLVDVSYTWDTQVVGPAPGGGGGGGGGGQQPGVTGNVSFSLTPSQNFGRPLQAGQEFTQDFTISCTSSQQCDLTVTIEQFEQDPSFRWATVRLGNNALTSYTFKVSPGNILVPGTAQFNVTVRIPVDAVDATYRFYVTATAPGVPVQRVTGTISVGGAPSPTSLFQDVVQWLFAPVLLPRSFFGIASFAPWHVFAAMLFLGIAVWYARFLTGGRKRS